MIKNVLLGVLIATIFTTGVTHYDLGTTATDELITVSFAGDCTLGCIKDSANSFGKYWEQNSADYFFDGVEEVFANDDVTFVNLEGPLTTIQPVVEKTYPISGKLEYVQALTDGSIEIVNLSNNHIYDCGDVGFKDTVNVLDQNGIGKTGEDYITGYTANGITVYFLGYKGWSDDATLKNKIAEDIKVCKEVYLADIVCVEFHWGEERTYYPNAIQTDLAHWTIDSGADIVIGAHPHVLQGIEKYNGKVIAYSLGNFCFGGNSNPKDKDTMILQVTFDKQGNYFNTEVIPCTVSSVDTTNDFRPTIQTGTERGVTILNRLIEYSSKFNETINW